MRKVFRWIWKKERSWYRISRDGILFAVGLSGIIHETFFSNIDRPTLLFVFMGMLGLPAFLRTDERRGLSVGPTPGGPLNMPMNTDMPWGQMSIASDPEPEADPKAPHEEMTEFKMTQGEMEQLYPQKAAKKVPAKPKPATKRSPPTRPHKRTGKDTDNG